MISGLLLWAVLGLMGLGRAPGWALLLPALPALALWRWGHVHLSPAQVDAAARRSPLSRWNGGWKLFLALAALGLGLWGDSVGTGLCFFALALLVGLLPGRLSPALAVRFCLVPLSFLLVGALVVMFSPLREPLGLLTLPLPGGWWLCLTRAGQAEAARVTARALGGLGWLCLLALTTPIPSLLAALNQLGMPKVVGQLLFLLYRYVFLLWDTLAGMRRAAACRGGRGGSAAALRTACALSAALLGRAMSRAGRSFDALECRGWTGAVPLEENAPLEGGQVLWGCALLAVLAGTAYLGRSGVL